MPTIEQDHRSMTQVEQGKAVVDWRAHVDKRPMVMLGAAFAGGLLAAALLGGRRTARLPAADVVAPRSKPRREPNEVWDRIRSGVGVAAATVAIEALSKAFPDFKEQVVDPVRSALAPEPVEAPFTTERRFSRPRPSRLQGTIFPA
jgi:hypothetical protein